MRACLISILAVVLACVVRADTGKTTGFFMGKIASIELPTRILKVENPTSAMTFVVAEDAKIIGSGQKELKLGDLKVGDEVTVDYTEEDGLMVAHTITVKEKEVPPPPGDRPLPY